MQNRTRIALALVAGFCDTATFIHMDGVFSAHVTGNFVVFAVALAQGLEPQDYLKIATFPVFVLAVAMATQYFKRRQVDAYNERFTLLPMLITLLICGGIALLASNSEGGTSLGNWDTLITLLLVFTLGAQNTLHQFLPGPMTTVMTGTVMKTTANLTLKYTGSGELTQPPQPASATQLSVNMMLSFTLGCVSAAFLTLEVGLLSVWLPAGVIALMMLQKPTDTSTH